jgi:hypothetical protein
MVKYTRVKYTRLDDTIADLLWEFITLPPSEVTHLESKIVHDVPPSMVEGSRSSQTFTLISDPYAKTSQLVCKTARSPETMYPLSCPQHTFTGVIISHEELDSNKHKLFPNSRFSGSSILTTRLQAHQIGWGHNIIFSRHKRYPCPYVDTLKETSDYYFKTYVNEIELTVRGDVSDDVILKMVTANLPRCFGHFQNDRT